MSKPTALHDVHAAANAHFTDFAGWRMPLRYGSELAEHHAVRTTAGLFDLSHMGEIEVTGPDAAEFLDYALVGDFAGLAVTKARYTMICQSDGGILDDLIVYRLDPQRYMVVANAANTEIVLEALQSRASGFEATVADSRDDWSLIAIQGPVATSVLQPITDVDLSALTYYAIAEGHIGAVPARLARTGYTGEDGFEIFCDPQAAVQIWTALMDHGDAAGVIPAGLACRDSLRLEAAMPLYGNELSRELSPYEAGLGRVVKLDKPRDFVGRQALQDRSKVPVDKVRVGLLPQGRRTPRAGAKVLDPATDQVVGHVTSGAPSPTLGHPIAMAYVNLALTDPGTTLTIDVRGTAVTATVTPLPFYRRPR
jgi:aminomethyltransferase